MGENFLYKTSQVFGTCEVYQDSNPIYKNLENLLI